jgi:hypothetical protein
LPEFSMPFYAYTWKFTWETWLLSILCVSQFSNMCTVVKRGWNEEEK